MSSLIKLQRLSLPSQGDFQQGAGVSTEQRAVANVVDNDTKWGLPGTIVAPEMHSAPFAQPVPVWIAIAVLLVVAKFAAEKKGDASDFSSIRLGTWNVVMITTVAILGINVAKWIFGYWRIPGISPLVLAS